MGFSLKSLGTLNLGALNLGNYVGSLLNDFTGSSDAAKQTYKYSQQAADADMVRSIQLWNLQNQYNTPAAQIARMQAAGIDVNPMTYALGSGGMSSVAGSISAPSTGGATVSPNGINPFQAAMSVIAGIQELQYRHEQVRDLKMANDEHEIYGTSTASPWYKRGMSYVSEVLNQLFSSDGNGSGGKSNVPRTKNKNLPAFGQNLTEEPRKNWRPQFFPDF